MKKRKVFYLIPNYSSYEAEFSFKRVIKSIITSNFKYIGSVFRNTVPPIGGIKIQLQHCELLNCLGFDARPALLGNGKIMWYEYKVKALSINDVGYELSAHDIIVCPETMLYEGLKFKNAKKIVFVQNWYFASLYSPFIHPEDLNKSYYELGYDKIITCSQFVTDYLREHGRGEAATITNGIDHSKFVYDPKFKEKNRILFMPRKNDKDAKKIIAIVKRVAPYAKFVKADELSESEIIIEYQKSDIFLATGYPEGFALPPLEAMACGCAVAGFTGGGGREYMVDSETAMIADDGDVEVAAKKLIELLCNEKQKEMIRLRGYEKAKEFSLESMKKDLKNFYENI